MFNASVRIEVGDGARVKFWADPWIHGINAEAIAPALCLLVPPRLKHARTVQDGLANNTWAADIIGDLTVEVVVQYLALWAAVSSVQLSGGQDVFTWKWHADGRFSSRTAYSAFFHGTTAMPGAANIWDSFAPLKQKLHTWFALLDRCWTADIRLRRGLASHARCPLCGVDDECMDHIAVRCPFSRRLWAGLFAKADVQALAPAPFLPIELNHWWPDTVSNLPAASRKAANSLITLGLWAIWIERNARVFYSKFCDVEQVIDNAVDEWRLWTSCRRGYPRVVG
ncbi:unnamed protein product [Alopecurus aequalis]